LGISSITEPDPDEMLDADELEASEWVTTCVGELIASAPSLAVPPTRQSLADTLARYKAPLFSGYGTAQPPLPRLPGVSWWLRGRAAPKISSLLKLCEALETSPLSLFSERSLPNIHQRLVPPKRQTPPSPRKRHIDRELLRRTLEASLASDETPPPSMRQIAYRLGYHYNSLLNLFPETCKAITGRFDAYRSSEKLGRFQQRLDAMCQATRDLQSRGFVPALWRIERALGHTVRWDKELVAAWRCAVDQPDKSSEDVHRM